MILSQVNVSREFVSMRKLNIQESLKVKDNFLQMKEKIIRGLHNGRLLLNSNFLLATSTRISINLLSWSVSIEWFLKIVIALDRNSKHVKWLNESFHISTFRTNQLTWGLPLEHVFKDILLLCILDEILNLVKSNV